MEVRAILERMGYKNLISDDWYKRIALWKAWYAGKAKFHSYGVYNRKHNQPCLPQPLGMAVKV